MTVRPLGEAIKKSRPRTVMAQPSAKQRVKGLNSGASRNSRISLILITGQVLLFLNGRDDKPKKRCTKADRRAVDKVDQHAVAASGQNGAQVSNLLYRRFPIGSASEVRERVWIRGVRRLEALRHSRLGNLRYDFVNGPALGRGRGVVGR
jgi:hypothetical protein